MLRHGMTTCAMVIGTDPITVPASIGHDVGFQEEARVFVVTVNPGMAPMLGPAAFERFILDAKAKDQPVFIVGRFIVHVFNRAYDSPTLTRSLVTRLVDAQHNNIPSPDAGSRAFRLRRRMRHWVRALFAGAPRSGALPAPASEPARAALTTGRTVDHAPAAASVGVPGELAAEEE